MTIIATILSAGQPVLFRMIGTSEYSAPNAEGVEDELKGERMLARILKDRTFVWEGNGIDVHLGLDPTLTLDEQLKSDGALLSLHMVERYEELSVAQTEKLLSLGWEPIVEPEPTLTS